MLYEQLLSQPTSAFKALAAVIAKFGIQETFLSYLTAKFTCMFRYHNQNIVDHNVSQFGLQRNTCTCSQVIVYRTVSTKSLLHKM